MNGDRKEVARIVFSMVTTCVIGAAVLGGVYIATARYSEAQKRATERREVAELLALDASATVLEIRQFVSLARGEVIYRIAPMDGGGAPSELVFDLDGTRVLNGVDAVNGPPSRGANRGPATVNPVAKSGDELRPLGRTFVAQRGATPAGFVVEGTANGYKKRIRFLVGLRPDFEIAGVRVVEHEEDPGLGAEIASPEFEGQFHGRPPREASLEVTRNPMPEDWRAALTELRRMAPEPWRARHGALLQREREKPIYAVTGATISSRALAGGVRVTVERFRSRWKRVAPYVRGLTTSARAVHAAPSKASGLMIERREEVSR